ncbi:hypothetical protein JCM18882A_31750 [Brevibacterium metallidurans]|uniref:Uncharacterized protein n=1 Tax=Brevibacterium metallidurans TaxID=1482676 RepID=A0ABP3CBA6_9MICO
MGALLSWAIVGTEVVRRPSTMPRTPARQVGNPATWQGAAAADSDHHRDHGRVWALARRWSHEGEADHAEGVDGSARVWAPAYAKTLRA